jgi:hypothetical protein
MGVGGVGGRSLWPLDHALAAELTGDFHRRWLSAGPHSDAAEALHPVCWIGSPDLLRCDPAYWAPTVLVERR